MADLGTKVWRLIFGRFLLLLFTAMLLTASNAEETPTTRRTESMHETLHTSRTVVAVKTTVTSVHHSVSHMQTPITQASSMRTMHTSSIHSIHASSNLIPHTSSISATHTSATPTTSIIHANVGCIYAKPAHGSCIANPLKAINAAKHQTTVVGATLGVILGFPLVAALAGNYVLCKRLGEANRLIREQSNVLWKATNRYQGPGAFEKPPPPRPARV